MVPGPSTAARNPAVQALRLAAAAAAGAADLDGYVRRSAGHMAQLLGAERCSILLDDGGRFRTVAAVGLSERFCAIVDGLEITSSTGACGAAIATGAPYVTTDIRSDPNWAGFRAITDEEGLRACWSVPLVAGGATLGSLAIYHAEPVAPTADQLESMETLASIVALGIDGLRRQQQLASGLQATVRALTSALDARDAYTRDHSTATSQLAVAVAARLGLAAAQLEEVERVAVLHDIGKIAIPNDILDSPRRLTPEQEAVMRTHPEVGERILRHVPGLEDVATAVRHEHERWDGGGYPDGLAGAQIPLASRIVFACDAYHAMTSDRPYRAAIGHDAAVAELRENAATQFDPAVVQALLDVLGAGVSVPTSTPVEAEERARDAALGAIARAVGADDVLVFRRVAGDLFSHIGGLGRGHGWAGNIELDAAAEPHLQVAVETGGCHGVVLPQTGRIVGPYFARSAQIAMAGPDVVVVFGAADDELARACGEHTLRMAQRIAEMLDEVPAAKRLADELEVLDAVRSVTTVAADNVRSTMRAIAARAAEALSCEFAAVVLHDEPEPRVTWVDHGWRPAGDDLDAGLVALARDLGEQRLLVQESGQACRVLEAVGDADGAAAVHVLPIGRPVVATLVVVHARPVMRGFTSLCQRVAGAMADAGETVLRRALAQERLARENAALSLRVRTDALTGVASRSGWDELVMAEELHRSRAAIDVSVAVFDVDGLKHVNDRAGHVAGDELLHTCAQILLDTSRATDVVARLGGDEFAVLLRYCDEPSAAAWCARVEDELRARGAAMTAGCAQARPGATIADAYALADERLCAAKTARGARRA